MKLNVPQSQQQAEAPVDLSPRTHEGGPAVGGLSPEQQLARSVLACMLWEQSFYEQGEAIADRIQRLVAACDPTAAMNIVVAARTKFKLRHAPLLIARAMARLPEHKLLVAHTLEEIIQRPDELAEFMAMYWKDKRQPISAQVKKGLARAMASFGEYGLAKYNREAKIELRDVLFMTHAKPGDIEGKKAAIAPAIEKPKYKRGEVLRHKESVFTRLVERTMATPDTWEVGLSGGADKKETFTRLIEEKKLGALALLRNLRNMRDAGVDRSVIAGALNDLKTERVLPFRFISAARAVPEFEDIIEPVMFRCLEGRAKLSGTTVLLVDVSGSMDGRIAGKSEVLRVDAACGLAILARELCDDIRIATFSNNTVSVPPRRGFALRDAILGSQQHSSTMLGQAVTAVNSAVPYDRLIIITDEQAHDSIPPPSGRGYVINVAAYENGVGYGAWTHMDGWSESCFDYLCEFEKSQEVA